LFPDHFASILDGALVGASSLWPSPSTIFGYWIFLIISLEVREINYM
jgi:hypothetical protein